MNLRASLLLALLPFTAEARDLSGPARVVDGDTLIVAGERVRLHGIDAPEAGQSCRLESRIWACGMAASIQLRGLIAGRTVTCDDRGRDAYGRMIATCWSGVVDIGGEMVRRGYAVAYRRYSLDYVAAEVQAKAGRRGIWAGEFEMPWNWRKP